MDMQGKTVAITGASSGIGEALAMEYTSRGAQVAAIARRGELLHKLTEDAKTRGGTILPVVADVTKSEDIQKAVHKVESQLGPIDLLISNAGVAEYTGAEITNVPGVEKMMAVNFFGVVYAFDAALPYMLARGRGHLVAVSSLASYRGIPGSAGYCASKSAVNAYCESLRIELQAKGVAVSVVCPGFIRTAMTAKNTNKMLFLMNADEAARRIVNGLRRKPKVFNFPWIMYRMIKASRWLPDRVVLKKVKAVSTKPDTV